MQRVCLTLLFYSFLLIGKAQTCCSGGVPLSNSIGLPFSDSKALQFNLSYDYNNLSTLIQDKEKLNDNARTRLTHTILMQVGLSLNERLSAELLLPYIKQDRKITQFGQTDFTTTSGVGDVTGLINYKVLKEKDFSIGIGLKAPTGSIDNKNAIGILLNSDLQPGSGAWDVLSLVRFSAALPQKKNTSFYASLLVNFKGLDSDYQPNLSYQFGNEQQLSFGLNSQVFALNNLWNIGGALRLRNVSSNRTNGQLIASTGGKWALGNISLAYWAVPAKMSINIGADVPFYTEVNGLQNVPTYRLNLSIYSLIEWGNDFTKSLKNK